MFRQPAFQKNALHEYLDNEDAATAADAAAAGGAYAGEVGFGGDEGWGERKAGSGEQDEGEDEDEEMKVTWDNLRLEYGSLTRMHCFVAGEVLKSVL